VRLLLHLYLTPSVLKHTTAFGHIQITFIICPCFSLTPWPAWKLILLQLQWSFTTQKGYWMLKQRFAEKIGNDRNARVTAVAALMYSILLNHSKMCFHMVFFRKQKHCAQNYEQVWISKYSHSLNFFLKSGIRLQSNRTCHIHTASKCYRITHWFFDSLLKDIHSACLQC